MYYIEDQTGSFAKNPLLSNHIGFNNYVKSFDPYDSVEILESPLLQNNTWIVPDLILRFLALISYLPFSNHNHFRKDADTESNGSKRAESSSKGKEIAVRNPNMALRLRSNNPSGDDDDPEEFFNTIWSPHYEEFVSDLAPPKRMTIADYERLVVEGKARLIAKNKTLNRRSSSRYDSIALRIDDRYLLYRRRQSQRVYTLIAAHDDLERNIKALTGMGELESTLISEDPSTSQQALGLPSQNTQMNTSNPYNNGYLHGALAAQNAHIAQALGQYQPYHQQ